MELSREEKAQKRIAVIDVMACDFSRSVLREALRNAALRAKQRAITKHDYMLTSKRDLHYAKKVEKVAEIDYDVLEDGGGGGTSKYSALGIQDYTSPYLRGYEKGAFKDSMKLIHKSFASFADVVSIDLSGQVSDHHHQAPRSLSLSLLLHLLTKYLLPSLISAHWTLGNEAPRDAYRALPSAHYVARKQ